MLERVERLEKMVFQGGNFTVKTVVILGRKSASGGRLDPIYTRSYPSRKYTDRETLETISFNQNEYLVFGYNQFDNNNPKNSINEEIFISYPHMTSLIAFFEDCYNLLCTEDLFTNNSVAVKYQDVVVESDEFCSGKRLAAIPAVWDYKDMNNNTSLKKGLLLFMNNNDICVQLDPTALSSLLYIVSNYNLSLECNQLLLMGLLTNLNSGSSYQQKPVTQPQRTTPQTPARGLFGGSSSQRRRPLGGGTSTTTSRSSYTAPQTQEEEPMEEPSVRQVGRSKVSMNDIMQQASEIDIEDIEDIEM